MMQSVSLNAVANEQLAAAREAGSGRSARTLHGGHQQALRQTLLALTAGHSLDEHESPGEATLQILSGRMRLTTATDSWEGTVGDYLVIPGERHGLTAIDDSAGLLTVAPHSQH
jgi:quercetin dioxygenase-like cupin family protein